MVKCSLARTSKSIKSLTHQQMLQNFPMHQFVYSNINIVIHIRNIAKSQKAVLLRFVHLHKICHSRKPTFTGYFKGSQSSNKTVNIGAKSCKHRAHTECINNYQILLLATLSSILTQKGSNDLLGRNHFGSHSLLYRQNTSQMPGVCTGRGRDGQFWNWLVYNNSFLEYTYSTFHSEGSRVSRKFGSSSSDERFTSELALELELELEWWDDRPCWRRRRFASNHLPTGSILREDGAKTIAQNEPQLLQIKS